MVREITVFSDADSAGKGNAGKSRSKAPVAKRAKKLRVAVFIDGSNLYFKLRTLIPHKMDFIRYRYRDLVAGLLQTGERLTYAGYYVGVVRDTKRTKNHAKTQELLKNQQKLFDQLQHQDISVVKGYLLERDGRYFEKGVDVRLAVDIVTMAQTREYDVGIVISSDTDLIPAMQAAQRLKRTIVYVGFEHQPSLALIRQADRTRLLTQHEMEHYITTDLEVRRYDD